MLAFRLCVVLLILPWIGVAQSLQDQISSLFDSVYQHNQEALGILIHVESPGHNISWTKAAGFSDKEKETPLMPEQPVLLASNTKTYVSAAILRLVENQQFALDNAIKDLLNKNTSTLLTQDGYDLNRITIRHLLSHTSGIHDYVNEEYFNWVMEHPQHQWTRDEQINRTIEIGEPLFDPGTSFSYGDINYLLLTEIIENTSKQPFYKAIRTLLKYDELGLHTTWFDQLEYPPLHTMPFAHQYANDFVCDSYEMNSSWDLYGGGGIASTVKDAALFYQYLFTGKIIQNNTILKEMHTYVLPPEESKYCLGIFHFDFGYNLYYHGGWWGTDVNYSPETNTSVAVFTLVKEKRNEINPLLGKRIQALVLSKTNLNKP